MFIFLACYCYFIIWVDVNVVNSGIYDVFYVVYLGLLFFKFLNLALVRSKIYNKIEDRVSVEAKKNETRYTQTRKLYDDKFNDMTFQLNDFGNKYNQKLNSVSSNLRKLR